MPTIFRITMYPLTLLLCSCALLSPKTPLDSRGTHQSTLTIIEPEQHEVVEEESLLIAEQSEDINELDETFNQIADTNNLWWKIRSQLKLTIPEKKRLISERKWYAKHPSYIARVSERASPYLYYIVSEIERRNMPMELALLPIVESAFDPFAYSHGRASGMWQFIPGTAKGYGLRQNWWYDGRRDVYHSTKAALDYLEHLAKRFKGDWLHAIAAYNSGEGHVIRAIRRNRKKSKTTDFWSLDLPKETEAYVPKLLALADLLARYDTYDLTWTPIANQPFFADVLVDSQIDLTIAAELSEISMDEFYTLNPGFNHWATEPKRSSVILVPYDKKDLFVENLKKVPAADRVAFQRYIIKPGDSLLKLSKTFNTTVELLRSTNGIKGNNIREGKSLLIPTASANKRTYIKSDASRLAKKQNRKRKGQKVEIFVQQGDSFWSLAKEHGVGMRELAAWNNMAPTDPLKIGKKLVIWSKGAQLASISSGIKRKTRKIYYKVRRGDSLARIAQKFKVRMKDLIRWNRVSPSKYLQPGQALTLFVDITRQY